MDMLRYLYQWIILPPLPQIKLKVQKWQYPVKPINPIEKGNMNHVGKTRDKGYSKFL